MPTEPLTSAEMDRLLANAARITGCQDHSCIVRPPTGMATNGGCRCGDQLFERQGAVQCAIAAPHLIARIRELEGQVRELARDRAYLNDRALLKEPK